MLKLRPIRTEADYRTALDEIEKLFDAEPNTLECDMLEILTMLVGAYEQQHYPIEAPEPINAILYYLESRDLFANDLTPITGSLREVTDILNRQQPLTIEMIRRLHSSLGIPAEVLIQPTLSIN